LSKADWGKNGLIFNIFDGENGDSNLLKPSIFCNVS
jgi:hypothetical protein